MNPNMQFEQDLERWLEAEAPARAPEGLHAAVIERARTMRQRPGWATSLRPRWFGRGRGLTLLVAGLLLVGGAVAAGSGLVRLPAVLPPALLLATPTAGAATPLPSPSAGAVARPGALIAYIRATEKPNTNNCGMDQAPTCAVPRLWIVGTDGSNAHELFPDGVDAQSGVSWSPDGTRLLYEDRTGWHLTDASGSTPQPVDPTCISPCGYEGELTFSSDGTRLVFVRGSEDGSSGIAIRDLASGLVTVLSSTAAAAASRPAWSPDGRQIVFWRPGNGDMGGPFAPILDAVFVVDADGQNLRQVTPATLAASNPGWSPDGSRIVFTATDGQGRDIDTSRPDGTDLRRLTTDGASYAASWTPDGRILFIRGSGEAPQGAGPRFWTMDADGANAAELAQAPAQDAIHGWTPVPAWQPIGGAAIVPPPWTASAATPVGPPPPTPVATATPALSPGFSWTGSLQATPDSTASVKATRLGDGRVLVILGCNRAAELYDPATGTFTPTGFLAQTRSGATVTLLPDGRVLVAGGGNCGGTSYGVWASAELYDPTTGTFSDTGSMTTPRVSHTATLLPNGRVLIAGGITDGVASGSVVFASYETAETASGVLSSAELYDPRTGTFTRTGSMSAIHSGHTATLLQDGRVLVVGGGGEMYPSETTVELYDPASGTFSLTGPMHIGRWLHTATLLPDGRVLVAGGRSPTDTTYASAEIYDPRTGTFTMTGSMGDSRQRQTATLLPDGRVLIAGGMQQSAGTWDVLSPTELYDPGTGTFSPAGSMGDARDDGTATLLVDGRVLLVGGAGIGTTNLVGLTSAVLYQP